MKTLRPCLTLFAVLTLLTGGFYPGLMTALSQVFFPFQSEGSLLLKDGKVIGSYWVSQKTTSPKYFWPRPSAVDYNASASGGSNLGPIRKDLQKLLQERQEKLIAAHGPSATPPLDLLFASGSGLDPEISPEAALYQLNRVALARNLTEDQRQKLQGLIEAGTEDRLWGFIGEPRVNVLSLNLKLDEWLKNEER